MKQFRIKKFHHAVAGSCNSLQTEFQIQKNMLARTKFPDHDLLMVDHEIPADWRAGRSQTGVSRLSRGAGGRG
jgi:hypothetical protein